MNPIFEIDLMPPVAGTTVTYIVEEVNLIKKTEDKENCLP
jgi:hypothetical protein